MRETQCDGLCGLGHTAVSWTIQCDSVMTGDKWYFWFSLTVVSPFRSDTQSACLKSQFCNLSMFHSTIALWHTVHCMYQTLHVPSGSHAGLYTFEQCLPEDGSAVPKHVGFDVVWLPRNTSILQADQLRWILHLITHFVWRSWLRHRATSRMVAGSTAHGVIGIFHRHNPSGRNVALGSTQPLAEMSTRIIFWGG